MRLVCSKSVSYPSFPERFNLEFGVAKAVDLIPNGSNVPVTRENRLQYIYVISHYKLSKQIKLQSEAFFEGLSEMIDPKWLRCVSEKLRMDGRKEWKWRADRSLHLVCSINKSCKFCWVA